jgi:hypothetical protein
MVLHRPAPPPDLQVSPQAEARVEEKFQQVALAVSNGEPAVMHMDTVELNSYLATHLELEGGPRVQYPVATTNAGGGQSANGMQNAAGVSGQPAAEGSSALINSAVPAGEDVEQMRSNVKDVKVQLLGDVAKAYVVFDVYGKDMTLELEGKLGSENGYLRFEPLSGRIGAFPLPLSALQGAMERLMESPENREKLRLPPDIADLKIENGEVVTTYR